jgi:hypothetical protein
VLRGRYIEHNDDGTILRTAGSLAFRRATHRHIVELYQRIGHVHGRQVFIPEPCWTLIITGPTSRVWGFWCKTQPWAVQTVTGGTEYIRQPDHFVPWYEWHDGSGVGCGDR